MNERIKDILNHKATIPTAVGVLSFAAGSAVGYLLSKRREAQEEVEPNPYEQLHLNFLESQRTGELPKTADLPIVTEYDAYTNADDQGEPEVVRKNVFESSEPYVITEEDYFATDLGYTKHVYTYFSEDDVMTSEDETPVYNYQTTVGDLAFGEGTSDPDMFFSRNDKLKREFQVIREEEAYSEVILGIFSHDEQ